MRRPASSPLCQESIDTTGRGAHTQVMDTPTRAGQSAPADRDARRDALAELADVAAATVSVTRALVDALVGDLAAIASGAHTRHGTPLLGALENAYLCATRRGATGDRPRP